MSNETNNKMIRLGEADEEALGDLLEDAKTAVAKARSEVAVMDEPTRKARWIDQLEKFLTAGEQTQSMFEEAVLCAYAEGNEQLERIHTILDRDLKELQDPE